ncbi:MAG: UDP-N-acetylmuramoyl-tripeptide--D-alanyl-D-alanine ligase [Candidatus Hatepunaea meridiana]|nr:UDP-N-acetylmuramoyl-tripeptide--D-alanyl-D-alanine ligase [Candidatus Hatepunaea meridiana]
MLELLVIFIIPVGMLIIGSFIVYYINLKKHLHLLQLEDYEADRMLRVVFRSKSQIINSILKIVGLTLLLITVLYIARSAAFGKSLIITVPLLYFYIALEFYRRFWETHKTTQTTKKPLVMTKRARRILWTSILLFPILLLIITVPVNCFDNFCTATPYYSYITEQIGSIYHHSISDTAVFYLRIATSVFLFLVLLSLRELAMLPLSLAVILLKPVESSIQNRYLKDAKRILKEMNPLVIGITGSYGKTSVKELLSAMLAEKYNVFRPPGSYNTLMGVTRIIREQLRPFHEVFIVEMGAYRIGSIAKLCRLVEPKYGIITIIGVQHLERFKTRENIKTAKGELVRALPNVGIAVLNGDDPACREIGGGFDGKVVYFSMKEADPAIPTIVVQNISISSKGSDFDLIYPDSEKSSVHLSLLGRSAIVNAATAAAMADQLGVSRRSITQVLASIPHVKHRLEPIQREGGVTVLDDAFNSNPIGAKNALEVLAGSEGGKRILVTPGMVELGELEEEANYEFGKQAAEACDLVVLVGKARIEPIKKGLLDAGFSEDQIWVESSLNGAIERFSSVLQTGDTMLLENDLPDQYDSL